MFCLSCFLHDGELTVALKRYRLCITSRDRSKFASRLFTCKTTEARSRSDLDLLVFTELRVVREISTEPDGSHDETRNDTSASAVTSNATGSKKQPPNATMRRLSCSTWSIRRQFFVLFYFYFSMLCHQSAKADVKQNQSVDIRALIHSQMTILSRIL
jgi:hypothetical protein